MIQSLSFDSKVPSTCVHEPLDAIADILLVSVITQFLTDRLEDETGLKEVANGLMALLGMQRFSAEDAEKVTLA